MKIVMLPYQKRIISQCWIKLHTFSHQEILNGLCIVVIVVIIVYCLMFIVVVKFILIVIIVIEVVGLNYTHFSVRRY